MTFPTRVRPLPFLACGFLAIAHMGGSSQAALVSTVYSFTYVGEQSLIAMDPIAFDADSLDIRHGSFLGGSLGHPTDMAVDESGRLFGFNGLTRQLLEFDPATLAVLNYTTITTGFLHGLAAHGDSIYAYTYADGVIKPVSFFADSLGLRHGSLLDGSLGSTTCMAVDETGRLFGYNGLSHQLTELDPDSLAILNSATIIGNLHGLAVYAGTIYSYTTGDSGAFPIALDADSLTLRQGTFLDGGILPPPDVAVDATTGRLFGFNPLTHQLVELDPKSLAILDSTPITGSLHGLAVASVPEPALPWLLALAAGLSRRQRATETGR